VAEQELLDLEPAPQADPGPDKNPGGVKSAKRLGFVFWLAVSFLAFLTFAAVFADLLVEVGLLKDPAEAFKGKSRDGPSATHLFGNDGIGRDIFSRTIYGAQVSLVTSVIGATGALLIGGTIGLAAGYYRERVEGAIIAVADATLVIPPLILALSLRWCGRSGSLSLLLKPLAPEMDA